MIKNVIGIAQGKKIITLDKELLDITHYEKDKHFDIIDITSILLFYTDLYIF